MKDIRMLLIGLVVAMVMGAWNTAAHAQRRMLVLIDASGSMTQPRVGDAVNPTRFHAAKALASQRVLEQEAIGLNGVAVYTFQDSTATARTAGFVSTIDALDAIDALDPTTTPFGVTPLAGSMCDAVDTLVGNAAPTKILQVSSDGEENATPIGHICQGPPSASSTPPFTGGSWQNLVFLHAAPVTVQIDLFNNAPIVSFARARAAFDPEATANARMRALVPQRAPGAIVIVDDRPPTLEEFFGALAQATGGTLNVVHDDGPLPVYADMNGDRCVNRADALLLARKFGQRVPQVEGKFDLNVDGKVGFADYDILLGSFTPGCGDADPYVAKEPVSCVGAKRVVIDGKAIQDGGTTIDARGACEVVIRNSLIVSGKNAINIVGSAVIRVDNSFIIGERAVLVSRGAAVLSAANTVFHGRKEVEGVLGYIDRGGNTWE